MGANRPFYSEYEKDMDLLVQSFDVNRCYPSAVVRRDKKKLTVEMNVQDISYQNKYGLLVEYIPNEEPVVVIKEPTNIAPNPDIHMYSDRSLCLYDPAIVGFRKRFSIAQEILPFTFKWIVYYETWLINSNVWIGPELPHGIRISDRELFEWKLRGWIK